MWIIKKLYAIWLSLLELLLGIDLAKNLIQNSVSINH